MASPFLLRLLLAVHLLFLLPSALPQSLPAAEVAALLELRSLLGSPPPLDSWHQLSPFCSLPPSRSVAISCSPSPSPSVVALHLLGNRTAAVAALPSLLPALSRLPSIRALTLSSLGLRGAPLLPASPRLRALNLSSNLLSGPLPAALPTALRSLDLSRNLLSGSLPDLSAATHLLYLHLASNRLGPALPPALPPQLLWIDLSANRLRAPLPPSLLALPTLAHVDISANSLSGSAPPCGPALRFLDLSRNRLVGKPPACPRNTTVLYAWNCLAGASPQHPASFCGEKPIAAVLPHGGASGGRAKNGLVLMLGIAGGIICAALALTLLLLVVRRVRRKAAADNAAVMAGKKEVNPADAKSGRVRIEARGGGTFDLKPYRVFTVPEIDEMTGGFDPANLMQESLELKIYRGRLDDGSAAVVRCFRIKQKYSAQSMQRFIDGLSKLRHRNLVCVLGHCIDTTEDHLLSTTSIYIVFELVSNGTLRSHLTDWRMREMLKWPQRVNAVIGVARGIQFLHNGAVPGIFGNDLNIENIMLDKTLAAKINNYNLPKIMLSKDKNNKVGGGDISISPLDGKCVNSSSEVRHGDQEDIYQMGLILLEVITGRPSCIPGELESPKVQLQRIVSESSPKNLEDLIDPAIEGTFAYDSLRTAMEVTLNCLSSSGSQRPSIDDVLWKLQYSLQIQDAFAGTDDLSGQF